MPFTDTARYADPRTPLPDSRRQRVAHLSWTDTTGAHEATLAGPATIGSGPACTIVIADSHVSRVHLELEPTDAGVAIRDLATTNGTFCGAIRIHRIVAADDLRIRLGPVELTIRQAPETVAAALWPSERYGRLIGRSALMRGLFAQIDAIARSHEKVVIHGETGTGKELVARAIHDHSPRATHEFVTVDCSSLHAEIAESELFGHAKGSYTGALAPRAGAFERADGGTLFLDEVGELPPKQQANLLRALESGTIKRLGETDYRKVNVRVVAASWRDLRELVNRGEFREDLYFRLAVIPLRVPPLRDRAEDIPLIVEHMVTARRDEPVPPDVMEKLVARPWPGNVRDLRNMVERASVLGWPAALGEEAVGRVSGVVNAGASQGEGAERDASLPPTVTTVLEPGDLMNGYAAAKERVVERFEREFVDAVLKRFDGDFMRAAAKAKVHNSWLRKLAKKYR